MAKLKQGRPNSNLFEDATILETLVFKVPKKWYGCWYLREDRIKEHVKPKTAGNYIIIDDDNRVVWTGLTEDFSSRLTQHLSNPDFRGLGTLRFFMLEVGAADDRKGVERFLANTLRPLKGDAWSRSQKQIRVDIPEAP